MEQQSVLRPRPLGAGLLSEADILCRLGRRRPAGRRSALPVEGKGTAGSELRGDHELNPELYDDSAGLRAAAVLVPIVLQDEEPQVLHYGERDTGLPLEQGMTFTIEPMINLGKPQVKPLPDRWTVVTRDRSLSAQWEHTILVTADGHEVLTGRPEEKF